MLWRVLLPLAATWFIGSAIALYLAWTFAGRAFDQALLDDAYAIAGQRRPARRRGRCSTCRRARSRTTLFDRAEEEYFAVFTRRLAAAAPAMPS